MDVPQLLIHPDAETIAHQIDAWGDIVHLSEEIKQQVSNAVSSTEKDWRNVLNLADKRDKLVDVFFNESVCQILLPQINDDLTRIKEQHLSIMKHLRDRAITTKMDEDFLKSAKEQITLLTPPYPDL